MEALVIALITSSVQFFVPFSAPCSPCPTPAPGSTTSPPACPNPNWIGNYKSFNCPAGQYNDLASLMFNTNDDAIRNLFSGGTDNAYRYLSLLTYFTAEYGLAAITYGIAVPSGLFVPTILCGASYGRMVGRLMGTLFKARRVSEGTYALLGAASFLGGAMRMTVSLCIILLELTGNLSMLPLIMLVLLVSKMVGDIFTEGVYDTHLQFRKVPLLEAQPEHFMKKLTAKDAVTGPPVVLGGIERVGHILEVLRSTTHNAFPVVDRHSGDDGLYGIILRGHLLVLLRHKGLFQDGLEKHQGDHTEHQFAEMDFGKPGFGKELTLSDVDVTIAEEDKYIDLHPFINASPYSVPEGMSLDKAYSLFRSLGLRHLCVVPKAQNVLGVLTRKDLLPEALEKKAEDME